MERVESQYQEEIVRRTWVRRFHVPVCRCAQCDQRVQGRHPLQTSDALGAAAVQVGPEAVTLGVLMNKSLGLPHADAVAILQQGFGLTMSRGGICRAIQRVARKAEATWHALRDAARRSALAHMDETGWKVEAQLRWLWAVVTEQVTFCEILPGRGFAEAAEILGAEYTGWLIHDGWAVYYKFLKAAHQSCVAHLIRRCRDLAERATPSAARFPLAVKQLLEEGLALRDRYLEQKISLRGLWTATGRLEAKLDRLLARTYRDPANRRLAKHLRPQVRSAAGIDHFDDFHYRWCPVGKPQMVYANFQSRHTMARQPGWGGGPVATRTPDPHRVKEGSNQLSYGPTAVFSIGTKLARSCIQLARAIPRPRTGRGY